MYDQADFRLDHQVAVMTGPGGGICSPTAGIFAAAGAAVMASDLDEKAAQGVEGAIGFKGQAFRSGRSHQRINV